MGNIHNNRGFSLVEALVAVGLVAIIGYGLTAVLTNSYKHQANLSVLLEGRELSGELVELSKSVGCGIKDLSNPMLISPSGWSEKASIPLAEGISGRFLDLKAGDKYSQFLIKKVSIEPYYDKKNKQDRYVAINGVTASDFATATIIKASLSLEVEAKDTPKAPVRTPIYLYLDPARTHIIGCESSLEDTDMVAICATMGGSWKEDENKCQLPCPSGLDQNEDGMCIVKSDGGDTYCNVNERCGVADKYLISI